MLTIIQATWWVLLLRLRTARAKDERGSTVETVILTALLAGLAISVATIIIAKVTAKAHSIDLNN
jgi:hypothetical protein